MNTEVPKGKRKTDNAKWAFVCLTLVGVAYMFCTSYNNQDVSAGVMTSLIAAIGSVGGVYQWANVATHKAQNGKDK